MNFHSTHNNWTGNIDDDYIEFKYLRENSKNVNFKRGVYENHNSGPKIWFIDKTYADKTILLKEKRLNKFKRNDDSRFFCRYCNIKSYKLDGIALKTHENNCSFNETNFNTITLKDFKGMLTKEGNFPKCDKYYNKLKIYS